uniref:Uncharacterized protein n=1 Tax=Cacopsylla melanoneura TaxID=428564 RepID=A0A8D8ZT85_9HEMI
MPTVFRRPGLATRHTLLACFGHSNLFKVTCRSASTKKKKKKKTGQISADYNHFLFYRIRKEKLNWYVSLYKIKNENQANGLVYKNKVTFYFICWTHFRCIANS